MGSRPHLGEGPPPCTPAHRPHTLQTAPNGPCAAPGSGEPRKTSKGWLPGVPHPPGQCTPAAHLHHDLQALGGHVPMKEAPQQILKGTHGVLVQRLEGKEVPAPLVTPLPTVASPLPPMDISRGQEACGNTSWQPSSPSGSGSTAMTLCRQPWTMSVCTCSSSMGSRELSCELRSGSVQPPPCPHPRSPCLAGKDTPGRCRRAWPSSEWVFAGSLGALP